MQDGTDGRGDTDAVDRRTLLRRAGQVTAVAAASAVALRGADAHAAGEASDAVQHVGPEGDDDADGRTPQTARRSWQAAIDALPPAGGVLAVAAGVHVAARPVVVRGKAVAVRCTPGAVLRAGSPMDALLVFDRVVDAPGVGVDGLTLDLAGLAREGLLVVDCWMTEHTVRVVGLGGGTAVHLHTERADFGCYYNRVRVKCVPAGEPAAGSTGVLVDGQATRNAANHNTLADCRLGNLGTGVRIGSFTDANTVVRTDCTACGVGYDLRSGTTHLLQAWEEANDRGFVVRDGAVAHLSALYAERWEVEGSGLLHHDRGVVAGPSAPSVEHVRRAADGRELRERWSPADGRLAWVAVDPDGTERELLALPAAAPADPPPEGYQELTAASRAPAAPDPGGVRLFVRTARAGGTELCARLPSGRIVVLAGEHAAPRSPKAARTRKARRPAQRPRRRRRRAGARR